MANVSKIKLDNNTYDIKDSIARNRDNYSTTEQAIGTWINGKTIYRKVYELTISTDTGGYYVYTGDSATVINIDTLLRFDYFVTNGTLVYSAPNTKDKNVTTYLQRSYGGIGLFCDASVSSMFNGKSAIVVLEYTKVQE